MELMEISKIWKEKRPLAKVNVLGWVKFNRDSGKIGFIELTDGTSIKNIQIVYKRDFTKNFDDIKNFRTASAILVEGELKITSNEKNPVEIIATRIELLKLASEDYPLQNKQHTFEFLREIAHLRVRSATFQAIMRIRSELSFAIHKFFNEAGFVWVASPIITSNDCEGAGENFVIQQEKQMPFFNSQAGLTVSGQLNAESYALGFKKVYTFGPTFRAEKSNTSRHLAEFWMVEPEMNFTNLSQLMLVIEAMVKSIVAYVTEKCHDEFEFLIKEKPELKNRLVQLQNNKFEKMEYAKAIEILKKAISNGQVFEDNDIFFGKDLASEHERFLCETHLNSPMFLINFPKDIKAFYMKINTDNNTVAACDLLVPGVGEIIGGSQREDDYKKIIERCEQMKINADGLKWYLDLRKYGYYSSSGFGLGLERFIMYICGVDNIKDAIPFPRTQGELKF